jgi:N4-(beta-N-acetylglucosaminyl)-L-asparaginase
MSAPSRPLIVSSANGLAATRRAYELLTAGADPLDAVVAGVTLVEDDLEDLTVGYGGLPNEEGVVELDAAVMHGPTHRAGAVAGLQNVRHAARLAQLVMEQTDHILLVGEGARQFARAQGFPEENLLTDKARKIWLYWKQTLSTRHDWIPPPLDQLDPAVIEFFRLRDDHDPPPPGAPIAGPAAGDGRSGTATAFPRSEADYPLASSHRPTGTIHCAAVSLVGDLAGVTSTSGLAFKMRGRVGDSAVIGAGLYVDNAVGSCGSTGRGEANLRNVSSFGAVELMRQGASPAEAGLEMLRRIVAQTTEPHLLRSDGRPNFGLKLYLLSKTGEHAGVSLWGPANYAVTDAAGTRLEPCRCLFDRETAPR